MAELGTFRQRLVDPGEISRANVTQNQQLADYLMQQTMQPQNIQHWTQGLAQLANAMNSQLYRQRAKRGQEALQKQEAEQLGNLLGSFGLSDQDRGIIENMNPQTQQAVIGQLAANRFTPPAAPDDYTLGNTRFSGATNQPLASVSSDRAPEVFDTLISPDGTRRIARRRGDPYLDELTQMGWLPAPTQTEQGAPGSFGNRDQEQRDLIDLQAATQNFVDTMGDAVELFRESPDINTWAARGASVINNLQQEAKALAKFAGINFDESVLDPGQYSSLFDQLGIENNRMRSVVTSLAFQAAAASGQSGRDVTERDIERFVIEIGGQVADPRAFERVASDVTNRIVRNFTNRYNIIRGEPFSGDFGMDAIFPQSGASGDLTPEEMQLLEQLRREQGVNR